MNSQRSIYLDHHATTPVDPRVFDVMQPWWTDQFGNAASLDHWYGDRARDAVESAREQVAHLVNCDPSEVIFTSGATESNNLALKGFLASAPAGSELIINAGEHRSVLDPAKRLSRMGHAVTIIGVNERGRVDLDELQSALTPKTRLVSVMWANNEVGTINPMPEIAQLCRERNIRLHTDAVQAVGLLPIDLNELPIDLLSLTAHKFYGPQGIGALIVKRNRGRLPLTPLIEGGGHERHLRSGTLPVALIVGFGAACQLALQEKQQESERLSTLRDQLWQGLHSAILGIHRNGCAVNCLPNNLNISIEGVDGDALLAGLTKIAVSSGSACSSADPEPSHVLRAMGRDDALTRASLRFGLGRSTTSREIETAIAHVTEVVKRLRS